MKTLKNWLAAAALVALSGGAQAALIARAGDMVYDDVLNITWLSDWNYAKTQFETPPIGTQGDSDGLMTWDVAAAWAAGLQYGGYEDWRLPEMTEYVGLWVDAGNDLAALSAKYSNVKTYYYWSNTVFELVPDPEDDPNNPPLAKQMFYTFNGASDGFSVTGGSFYAVAVRTGDVGASVPEPQTLALTLLALGAALLARRRRAG